jgi:hypothetical protein
MYGAQGIRSLAFRSDRHTDMSGFPSGNQGCVFVVSFAASLPTMPVQWTNVIGQDRHLVFACTCCSIPNATFRMGGCPDNLGWAVGLRFTAVQSHVIPSMRTGRVEDVLKYRKESSLIEWWCLFAIRALRSMVVHVSRFQSRSHLVVWFDPTRGDAPIWSKSLQTHVRLTFANVRDDTEDGHVSGPPQSHVLLNRIGCLNVVIEA